MTMSALLDRLFPGRVLLLGASDATSKSEATPVGASGREPSDWSITVSAFDLTHEQAHGLFDRVADAAHALDEQVTVGMGPMPDDASGLTRPCAAHGYACDYDTCPDVESSCQTAHPPEWAEPPEHFLRCDGENPERCPACHAASGCTRTMQQR